MPQKSPIAAQPPESPPSSDVDAPPDIRRDSSLSPIDGDSLLRCLKAPTRKPTATGVNNKSLSTTKPPAGSTAFSSRIGNVVRDAFNDVKSRRSSEREQLVRSVIDESLGDVVMSSLADCKQSSTQSKALHKRDGLSPNGNGKKRKKQEERKDGSRNGRENNHDGYKDIGSTINGSGTNGYQQQSPQKAEAQVSMQRMVFPRLPSNNCRSRLLPDSSFCTQIPIDVPSSEPNNLATDKAHGITIKTHDPNSRTETSARHQPLLIEGAHQPRPTQSSVIFLKSFFSAEDERNLAHVPYFGEEEIEDFDWDLFDVNERMKLFEYGPPYCEKETIETIDEVLKLVAEKEPAWFDKKSVCDLSSDGEDEVMSMSSSAQIIQQVHTVLAELSNLSFRRVKERHAICFARTDHDSKPRAKKKETTHHNPGSPSRAQRKSFNTKGDPSCYQEVIDSYRDLFCRVCFTYDCQVHGNIPKPDLQLLGELAVTKAHEGHWDEVDKDIGSSKLNASTNMGDETIRANPLSKEKKAMLERLYVIFGGDAKIIARALDESTTSVSTVISEKELSLQPHQFVSLVDTGKKKKGKEHYQSMKNYNPKWLANIQGCEIHPAFIPCDHTEPCSENTCSCVKNKFFCHKACAWGSKSKNFFRGCACKAGQCRSSSCACWAANRECDPDLCKACGACTDPPQQLAEKQRCRNDNISMRRHAHLLLAESSINAAGWGLFTKHKLQKGSYVHEYVGEVISQEEAERRGIIYDKLNMSYLFNLSSDYTVDATRKGNKVRYANHSSTAPNCEAKMIRVNGDMRIGLFAKIDIDAQSELFFDYRYDETIDNELIIKPAHKFHWMKSPERKNSKKPPPDHNISMKAAKKNAY